MDKKDSAGKSNGRQEGSQKKKATPAAPQQIDLSPMLASTTARVQEVLETTDQAAQEILESAREEARRYVTESKERAERLSRERIERIATLTDDLMAKAATIQQQSRQLGRALEAATVSIGDEFGLEDLEQPVAPAPAPQAEEPATEEEPVAEEEAEEATEAEAAPEAEEAPAKEQKGKGSEKAAEFPGQEGAHLLGMFSRRRKRREPFPFNDGRADDGAADGRRGREPRGDRAAAQGWLRDREHRRSARLARFVPGRFLAGYVCGARELRADGQASDSHSGRFRLSLNRRDLEALSTVPPPHGRDSRAGRQHPPRSRRRGRLLREADGDEGRCAFVARSRYSCEGDRVSGPVDVEVWDTEAGELKVQQRYEVTFEVRRQKIVSLEQKPVAKRAIGPWQDPAQESLLQH